MGAETKIQWTDATWNPLRGCSRVSEGCRNCYAEAVAGRFSGPGQPYEGTVKPTTHGPRWNGNIRLVPEHLGDPLRWRKPRRVFANSMSDLFHENVPDEFIAAVFGVMAEAKEHTFQVLTKRPERMREWFRWIQTKRPETVKNAEVRTCWLAAARILKEAAAPYSNAALGLVKWPLPNVWLGVSAENQATADERIPILLDTPAAVRFVSAEPLLGKVDLRARPWRQDPEDAADRHTYYRNYLSGFKATSKASGEEGPGLDWVIVGGESGPKARPCDTVWVRSVVQQCKAAGVPCFVKQLGAKPTMGGHGRGSQSLNPEHEDVVLLQGMRHRKGGDPSEWPEDLRVQEWPS